MAVATLRNNEKVLLSLKELINFPFETEYGKTTPFTIVWRRKRKNPPWCDWAKFASGCNAAGYQENKYISNYKMLQQF